MNVGLGWQFEDVIVDLRKYGDFSQVSTLLDNNQQIDTN